MILVDVYVPGIDKSYDFYLNENALIKVIIEDMAEMICQKEQYSLKGKMSDLTLWIPAKRKRLEPKGTLYGNMVRSGDRLMLV